MAPSDMPSSRLTCLKVLPVISSSRILSASSGVYSSGIPCGRGGRPASARFLASRLRRVRGGTSFFLRGMMDSLCRGEHTIFSGHMLHAANNVRYPNHSTTTVAFLLLNSSLVLTALDTVTCENVVDMLVLVLHGLSTYSTGLTHSTTISQV